MIIMKSLHENRFLFLIMQQLGLNEKLYHLLLLPDLIDKTCTIYYRERDSIDAMQKAPTLAVMI